MDFPHLSQMSTPWSFWVQVSVPPSPHPVLLTWLDTAFVFITSLFHSGILPLG